MHLTLYLKTPGVLDDALDAEGLKEEARDEARDVASRFVRNGEVVKVEIDLLRKTATVLMAN